MDIDFDEDYRDVRLPAGLGPPLPPASAPVEAFSSTKTAEVAGDARCDHLPDDDVRPSESQTAAGSPRLTEEPRPRVVRSGSEPVLRSLRHSSPGPKLGAWNLRTDSAAPEQFISSPAQAAAVLPEQPTEQAFVSTRASVRRREYAKLHAWLSAGGAVEQFVPWFREMFVMDKDPEAFAVACGAVSAHYREVAAGSFLQRKAAEIGGSPLLAAPPMAWLGALGERFSDGLADLKEHAAAAEVCASAAECWEVRPRLREDTARLLAGSATCAGTLRLLAACAGAAGPRSNGGRGVARGQGAGLGEAGELQALLQRAEVKRCLECGDDNIHRAFNVLLDVQPSLRSELSPVLTAPVLPPHLPERNRIDSTRGAPGGHEQRKRPWELEEQYVASREVPRRGSEADAVCTSAGLHCEILLLLNEKPVGTWRERLACLQRIGSPEAPECANQCAVPWPQLILQAEDGNHPAVAAAALRAIARLAARPGGLGDRTGLTSDRCHMARLAKALRARFREGRSRGVDAACACLGALVRQKVFTQAFGPLTSFLAEALDCTRDQARAAAAAIQPSEEPSQQSWPPEDSADSSGLPLPVALEELVRMAIAGRRTAPPRAGSSPASLTPSPGHQEWKFGSGSPSRASAPGHRDVASPALPSGPDVQNLPFVAPTPPLPHGGSACVGHAGTSRPDPARATCTFTTRAPTRTPGRTPSRYAKLASSPGSRADCCSTEPEEGETSLGEILRVSRVPDPPASLLGEARRGRAEDSNASRRSVPDSNSSASQARTPPRRSPKSCFDHLCTTPVPVEEGTPAACANALLLSSLLRSGHSSFQGPQLRADSRFLTASQVLMSHDIISSHSASTTAVRILGPRTLCQQGQQQGFHAVMSEGLTALETGQDLSVWYDALRMLAAWDAKDITEEEVESVVGMLLSIAPRLLTRAKPELWHALSELHRAAWFPEAAIIELTVGHCLAFIEPRVVADFLAARVAEGRLKASACLDHCLSRFPKIEGQSIARVAQLFRDLASLLVGAESNVSRPSSAPREAAASLADLTLPSMAEAMGWAASAASLTGPTVSSAAAALAPFHAAIQLLVPHLTPDSSPEALPLSLLSSLVTSSEFSQCGRQGAEDVQHDCDPGEELRATFTRLHHFTVELGRAESEDVPAVLQSLIPLLQAICRAPASLRAFLDRVVARQRRRIALKENFPPQAASKLVARARHGAGGDFLDDDYASVREVAAEGGLVGSFPHSVLSHLKRLLKTPAAAGTHRAACECLLKVAAACGPVLLRILLRHFAGSLLRLAAVRSPSQAAARAVLTQFVVLSDDPTSTTPCWLRLTWRAVAQSMGSQKGGPASEPGLLVEAFRWLSEDLLTLPRSDARSLLRPAEAREVLSLIAPALQDRTAAVRAASARALWAVAGARGGEMQLREDVLEDKHPQLTKQMKAAALTALELQAPPPPQTPSLPAFTPPDRLFTGNRRAVTPASAPALGGVASSRPRRLQFSPLEEFSRSPEISSVPLARPAAGPDRRHSVDEVPCSPEFGNPVAATATSPWTQAIARGGLCRPRLAYSNGVSPDGGTPSPNTSDVPAGSSPRTCCSSACNALLCDLEADLAAWKVELTAGVMGSASQREERTAALRSRLEALSVNPSSAEVAAVVLNTLALCERYVAAAAEAEAASKPDVALLYPGEDAASILRTAVAIASAAGTAFPAQALQHLCVAAAATAFRSMLRTLSQLQPLSNTLGVTSSAAATRRAAASLLLELPPLFSRLMDALQAPVQLVAWVRVAGELLAEAERPERPGATRSPAGGDPVEDPTSVRCWALRFCTRCVQRVLPALPPQGSTEFPAWEVFSELLQVHERFQEQERPAQVVKAGGAGGKDEAAWAADIEVWYNTLEKATVTVARLCPAQARAFISVASCTGSSLPSSLRGLVDDEKELSAVPPSGQP